MCLRPTPLRPARHDAPQGAVGRGADVGHGIVDLVSGVLGWLLYAALLVVELWHARWFRDEFCGFLDYGGSG